MAISNIFIKINEVTNKISKFIENHTIVVIIAIILCGSLLRFSTLFAMGFPLDVPLNGGGLYYQFSKTILENNFSYPVYIPFYTENGLPFAYPPLCFYIIACFSYITHIKIITLHIYFPIIISALTVIAFYFLTKRFFHEKNMIIFSTFLYAILSYAFADLIVGEGLVESFGVLIFLIGFIYLDKSFTTNNLRYTIISGILFGITILLSPGGAYAFSIALIVLLVIKGKNLVGIKKIFSIAIIGFFISVPWWLNVIKNHGFNTLLNGFFSRQGTNIFELLIKLAFFDNYFYEAFIATFCLIGLFYCLVKKEYLLPVLFFFFVIAGEITYIIPIFAILLVTIGLFKVIIPSLNSVSHNNDYWSRICVIFFIIVICFHALGMSYINLNEPGQLKWALNKSNVNVEKNDLDAMKWIENNTNKSSIFIVISDDQIWWLNDWFPALTQRTTVNTVFGSEWTNKYKLMLKLTGKLNECNNIVDLTNLTSLYSIHFTDIYFSKSQSNQDFINNLTESKQYKKIYENDGGIVFESTSFTTV
ncbi:MAG: glycosyltransferase family 39 protein [Methanoregula sp.]|uniref:glycosyltransferase family 39 protein n=1 Tax=Methanoregula sp. TaxID=2052170 RepID=UPI003C240436